VLEVPEVIVDAEKCTGCGTCVEVCPVGVFELQGDPPKSVPVKPEECLMCEACVAQCPEEAITVKEES